MSWIGAVKSVGIVRCMIRMRDIEMLTNLMQISLNAIEPIKSSLLKMVKPVGEVLECNNKSIDRVNWGRR